MKIRSLLALFAISALLVANDIHSQSFDNWTHFRGSDLSGLAAPGDYPTLWNDSTNISWKVPIEGRAWSSPIVYENQIWLSSASVDGKEMFALCLDFEHGEELFNVPLFTPDTVFRKHAINSYATPTGAIEESFVYISFGRYGTACINTRTGEKVWARSDLQCEHVQGAGSSLFLYQDKLIVHMEGTDVQNIYALDKRTGETIWIAKRDPALLAPLEDIGKKAYVTPVIIEVDGRVLLISNGSAACNAYDIETGEEIWVIPQGEDSTISMPVLYKGKVYFYTSFLTPDVGEKYCELLAVDPRGKGDISGNILWRKSFPILQLLTPVIWDDLLFTIDTKNDLYCLNTANGEVVWTERLKGKYNSSPILANGLIYVSTTRGETLVFKAGPVFELIAKNKLDGETWSTPAFVNESILIRTSHNLVKVKM